jgi:2-polyprenyl-6-hydroxyphenyl methylase/3-demethylubiquinone-9 3-methyltransferase
MSTVLRSEIDKFSKDAPAWWDEKGAFAPLHRLNPARMGYIRGQIDAHFGLDRESLTPFKGLSILDVGCGGGLVCEPLARLGADVTGIDADPVAIEVAKEHAEVSGLDISYKNTSAESLLSSSRRKPGSSLNPKDPGLRRGDGQGFDVVLALEIIEHVDNPAEFVKTIGKLVKPGGLVIFSTLNRTPKSFALGIVAAEYVMRIVPRGTHEWRRFVRPSELAKWVREAGQSPMDVSGLVMRPLSGKFEISKNDMAVNYFMMARQA